MRGGRTEVRGVVEGVECEGRGGWNERMVAVISPL